MRRRLLLLVSFALLLGGGILLGLWIMRPQPRIDRETAGKIQPGLTEADVIALIGAPPGDYGVGEGEILFGKWWMMEKKTRTLQWLGKDVGIIVDFHADGQVADRYTVDVWRPYDSHFDYLLYLCNLKAKNERRELLIL